MNNKTKIISILYIIWFSYSVIIILLRRQFSSLRLYFLFISLFFIFLSIITLLKIKYSKLFLVFLLWFHTIILIIIRIRYLIYPLINVKFDFYFFQLIIIIIFYITSSIILLIDKKNTTSN